MKGKDHCYTHRPKEVEMAESAPAPAALNLEDTLEAMSELLENVKDRVGRLEKKADSLVERQDVMEGRQDVFHTMLEEDARIEREWKPIPRERYPADFINDPNNKWVMVTPIADGEITVRGKGTVFTVPFRRGITMGTLTAFVTDARHKGLIP